MTEHGDWQRIAPWYMSCSQTVSLPGRSRGRQMDSNEKMKFGAPYERRTWPPALHRATQSVSFCPKTLSIRNKLFVIAALDAPHLLEVSEESSPLIQLSRWVPLHREPAATARNTTGRYRRLHALCSPKNSTEARRRPPILRSNWRKKDQMNRCNRKSRLPEATATKRIEREGM